MTLQIIKNYLLISLGQIINIVVTISLILFLNIAPAGFSARIVVKAMSVRNVTEGSPRQFLMDYVTSEIPVFIMISHLKL